MNGSIFELVKESLHPRLEAILPELLPGGRVSGREYICASLSGDKGKSCSTNLDTGIGSDFATGESWRDIIDLYSQARGIRQGEAARELADRYGITLNMPQSGYRRESAPKSDPPAGAIPETIFTPITPVPDTAPARPEAHPQHGRPTSFWHYQDRQGNTLAYTARFDFPDHNKIVLPLCYGQIGEQRRWQWKALSEPRPLYGLQKLAAMPDATVLLVEGEKTADAGQGYFPKHAVLTWSGGAESIAKTDLSPLQGRQVAIWPDNDQPGFKAALTLAELLQGKAVSITIVQPPDTLPEKWDLADSSTPGFIPQVHIETALPVSEFRRKALLRYSALAPIVQRESEAIEELTLREWPRFSLAACPGILGEFVSLATRDSEADPAAVCVTMLTRFAAEVYGHAENKGPYKHSSANYTG
jgi:hypothetical protein